MMSETKNDMTNPVQRLVVREYSQGICRDGAAILCDGAQMTIEEILARLRTLEDVRAVIHNAHVISGARSASTGCDC